MSSIQANANPTMLADLIEGLRRHRLWRFIAQREIARQYKRTIIGVLWIPLHVLLHVLILGAVFTLVMDGGGRYFAYFALSYAIWKPFGQMLGLASNLWKSNDKYVKHLPGPISLYVIKAVYRVTLVLVMSLPVGIGLAYATGAPAPGWPLLLVIPGVVLFVANMAWITTALSVICLRFRDVRSLVPNMLFVIYLGTPIMWEPSKLGDHQWIAQVNPLYHLFSVIREPVLGAMPAWWSWAVALGLAVVGNLVAWSLLGAVRRRIPLWL
ncbi:MAG: sugar ABC transporter permease [Phycisphaeraceae bacterium]|nr:MAG: sugar ABC transporter permease [Phycisphaeraceae bacterium]